MHVAQALKRQGCRVLVHDFAANIQNSPSLLEFEVIADLAKLKNDKSVKAVVICCEWEGYQKVALPKGAKITAMLDLYNLTNSNAVTNFFLTSAARTSWSLKMMPSSRSADSSNSIL